MASEQEDAVSLEATESTTQPATRQQQGDSLNDTSLTKAIEEEAAEDFSLL